MREYKIKELAPIVEAKPCEIAIAIRAGELKARQDCSYSGCPYFITLDDWVKYKDGWTEQRRIFKDIDSRSDSLGEWITIKQLCELYPEFTYRIINYSIRQIQGRHGENVASKVRGVWQVHVNALLQYIHGRAYD